MAISSKKYKESDNHLLEDGNTGIPLQQLSSMFQTNERSVLQKGSQRSESVVIQRVSIVSQLVDIIRERLRAGVYPPNLKLPSGEALAEEFNVSRATVRASINVLATHGLLRRRNGVGVFAAPNPSVSNSLNEPTDFYRLIKQNDREPGVKNIKAVFASPPPTAMQAMAMGPSDEAVMTWKIFTADDAPVIYCENTIAISTLGDTLAHELKEAPKLNDSLFSFLEERRGLTTSHVVAELSVSRAEECDFPGFDFPDGTPVLVINETGFDLNETPIWHSRELYPDNSIRFGLLRRR
jgi:GntR family transcriptional regulator